MKQMRQFLTTLSLVWIAACIAAYLYSHQQHISSSIALAVVPAFLVELAFYLAPGFPAVRKKFDALGSKSLRAALLSASGVLPYLMEASRTGTFGAIHFLELTGVVVVAAFWYAWVPRGIVPDLIFLGFMAAVYLSSLFDQVYGHPAPHAALGILGKLMWIRLGLMAVLSLRPLEDARFGFVPSPQDWRVGLQHYLYFLPVGAALGYWERFARFHPQPLELWKFLALLVGTFAGILWVVALAEEFFFRAFLQQVLARRAHSETFGLLAASLLFGLAHLPFRGFPNWRAASMAAVLGLFCGLALIKARSVKASMVTHALVVTTWRMFFTT
jgi:membrane protease YdiL (CAAX protease family)